MAEGHIWGPKAPQPAKRACLPQGLALGARSAPFTLVKSIHKINQQLGTKIKGQHESLVTHAKKWLFHENFLKKLLFVTLSEKYIDNTRLVIAVLD